MKEEITRNLLFGNLITAYELVEKYFNDGIIDKFERKEFVGKISAALKHSEAGNLCNFYKPGDFDFYESSSKSSVNKSGIFFPIVNIDALVRLVIEEDYEVSGIEEEKEQKNFNSSLKFVKEFINREMINFQAVLKWGFRYKFEPVKVPGIDYPNSEFSINGKSYQLALNIAFIQKAFDLNLPGLIAFTGEVDDKGMVKWVNSVENKLKYLSKERKGLCKVFIPADNEIDIANYPFEVIKVKRVEEVCFNLWGKNLREIVQDAKVKEKPLGACRMRLEQGKEVSKIYFEQKNDLQYDEFPVKFPIDNDLDTKVIMLTGRVPNHYVGYNLAQFANTKYTFAIGRGSNKKAIIFHVGKEKHPEFPLGAEIEIS